MRRTVAGGCLFFLLVAHGARRAEACRCEGTNAPLDEQVHQAWSFACDIVSGKVMKLEHVGDNSIRAHVEVGRTWKGIEKDQVVVSTASHDGECGFRFEEGKEYLIYASHGRHFEFEGVDFQTTSCTRTRLLNDAAEDIRVLEQLDEPKSAAQLLEELPAHLLRTETVSPRLRTRATVDCTKVPAGKVARRGTPVVNLEVGVDGVPRFGGMAASLGAVSDELAKEAALRLKFYPGTRGGFPVPMTVSVPIMVDCPTAAEPR